MEEKTPINISKSTIVLITFIIILIISIIILLQQTNTNGNILEIGNNTSKNETQENSNNITNENIATENINKTEDSNGNNISNTINNNTINKDNFVTNNENTTTNKYEEIINDLNEIDILYVTDVEKNDTTYTLKGVIYTQYTISSNELQEILDKRTIEIEGVNYIIKNSNTENEYDLYAGNALFSLYKIKPKDPNTYYLEAQAQISNVWKMTKEYKEITVFKDTKCSMFYDEENNNTVEDIFKNFGTVEPIQTTNPFSERSFCFRFENGECVEVINVLTSI